MSATKFRAEIKKVSATKHLSNDKVITVQFVTDDETALALAHVPADATVMVSVE